jgi:Domain of unknown function (DUF397)
MNEKRYTKSSRSGGNGGNCVELAHTLDTVRDSKNGQILAVDVTALLTAVKTGRIGA